MNDQQEPLSEEKQELIDFKFISCENLGSDILDSKRGKFAKLLDSDQYTYNLGKAGKEIEFNSPIFMKSISFTSPKEKQLPEIEIVLERLDGTTKSLNKVVKSQHGESRGFILVNDVVKKFTFRSDRIIRDQRLSRIHIFGAPIERFLEMVNSYNNFSNIAEKLKTNLKNEFESLDERIEEVEQKELESGSELEENKALIKSQEMKIEEFKRQLESLKGDVESENEQIETLKKSTSQLEGRETNISNSIEQLTEQKSSLNRTISQLKEELERLTSRKDLYSEDMNGLNSESASQLKVYYALLGMVFIALGWIGLEAVEKVNHLIDVYTNLKVNRADTTGMDLILMRLPYATIILTVISALIFFAKTLVSKIFEINSEKRKMIALSVVARDITFASTKGLDISNDEMIERREQLKFDLLSSSIIGDSFSNVKESRRKAFEARNQMPLVVDDDQEEAIVQ